MANAEVVVAVMRELIEYYKYSMSADGLKVYVRYLQGMDEWILRQVVDEWIRSSRFFPKVSELLERAEKVVGSGRDRLFDEAEALKRHFLERRVMDPAAWERVAINFEQIDELELACWVRETQRRLSQSYDENGECTRAARLRYLEWESLSLESDSPVEQESSYEARATRG